MPAVQTVCRRPMIASFRDQRLIHSLCFLLHPVRELSSVVEQTRIDLNDFLVHEHGYHRIRVGDLGVNVLAGCPRL